MCPYTGSSGQMAHSRVLCISQYTTNTSLLLNDWSLFADDDVLPESVAAGRMAQETMAAGLDSKETRVSSVVAGNRLVAWVSAGLVDATIFAGFPTALSRESVQCRLLGGVT
jgi:hypothetical protein